MSRKFQKGLKLVIGHLKDLRDSGQTHVDVTPEVLSGLSRRPCKQGARSVSAPAQRPVSSAGPGAVRAGDKKPVGIPGSGGQAGEKSGGMATFRAEVVQCRKCAHLASSRTQVVFGVGSVNARILFVGEAPGEDEDRQGEPFVGRAGQLLTKMIQAMGLERKDVYIANILKCRPDMPPGQPGNRPPTIQEIETCRPYLVRQIELIRPEVIVALGASAMKGLFGDTKFTMSGVRGQWRDYLGIALMPTFHPSYLLRKAGPGGIKEKRKAWEDLLAVMERLSMPISGKQRNYFLSAI